MATTAMSLESYGGCDHHIVMSSRRGGVYSARAPAQGELGEGCERRRMDSD
jgi:hypothetical protein